MDENQGQSFQGMGAEPSVTPPSAPTPTTEGGKEKSVGPIVGIVIILIVIILGGLYFWGRSLSKSDGTDDGSGAEEITNEPDPDTAALENVSESDVIADIEADLNTTDLENLDFEVANIESDLGN